MDPVLKINKKKSENSSVNRELRTMHVKLKLQAIPHNPIYKTYLEEIKIWHIYQHYIFISFYNPIMFFNSCLHYLTYLETCLNELIG